MLARYGPLVSAALTVVGAFSVPAAVAAGTAAGMTAVEELRKKPDLDRALKKASQSVTQDLDHPRQQVGAEAEAVEAQVLEMCRQSRQGLLLAALGEPAEFRAALPGLDTVLMSFSGPAQHYAELVVERLGRLVHEFALSPEVYPELGQEQLKEVRAVLEGRLDGADQERADLQSQLDELREALVALQQELDRRPPRIVEVGSMPERAAHFVERSDLGRAQAALMGSGTATLCAVSGMRGVGKSQLAAAYARGCINEGWGFVVWVSATSRAAAVTQMSQIARNHGLTKEPDDERAAQWLVSWLSGAGPDPRLLVFDNVEAADDLTGGRIAAGTLIPKSPGMRVLVTTTTRTDALGERLNIDVYSPAEAVGYLVNATGNPDRDEARAVAEALGYLPVALSQAANTIRRLDHSYLSYLKTLNSRAVDQSLHRLDGDPYPLTVGAALRLAFETTIDHIQEGNPDAATSAVLVLDALALLAESGAPRSWLHQASDLEYADREAVGALIDAGIIALSEDHKTVSLHRLQGRVWREGIARTRGRMIEAIDTAAHVLSQVPLPDDADWREKQAATQSIANQLIDLLGQKYSESVTRDPRVLRISVSVVKWCIETGLAGLAVQLTSYSELHQQVLGPSHLDTLVSCGNLAFAYRSAGRMAEAVLLHEKVLSDCDRVLGPTHATSLTARNNLAASYRSNGRLDRAIPLFEQTLAEREGSLGSVDPATLISRSNLAGAYAKAGRLGEAILLYEQACAEFEQVLGGTHPDTLTSRNNLAYAYRCAGRLAEAIPLFEQTLVEREQTLDPRHPATLTTRNNLAGAYRAAGRLEEAICLYERTVADREQVLGSAHPGTLASRNNLAVAYRAAGRLDEAILVYREALGDYERVLGVSHPDTIQCRGNLALACKAAGWLAEAASLYEQALADSERVVGPDHPSTVTLRRAWEKH